MTVGSCIYHKGRILGENQTYDASIRCPLCNSKQLRKPVAEIQKSPLITLLSCSECGGSSAARMPKQQILKEYYLEYYENEQQQHITFHNPARFAQHILKLIPKRFSADESVYILDYGGGDGALSMEIARLLQPRKVCVTVVDYEESGLVGAEGIAIEKTGGLEGLSRTYDIIIASAVIEHIPEPGAIITNLFSLLKGGGYFYARTPWVDPLMKIIKMDFGYPGHVHDLGPAFWNRFIETFSLDAEIVASEPSIVETAFSKNFLRTLAAHIMKLPALLECKLIKGRREPLWKYVGGWEVLLRKGFAHQSGEREVCQ